MYRVAVCFLAVLVSGSALADEVLIAIDDSKPGAYLVIVGADRSVTANPTKLIRPGANPVPNPVPTPTPIPSPNPTLAAKVRTLTLAALAEGGSHNTAAILAGVYSVVADQVNAGTIPIGQASAALKFLSDQLIPANETAAWTKWRTGVGDAMTGLLSSKDGTVSTLRSVSEGTKSAVDGSALASGGNAINWKELFKILPPILLQLLAKFLNPMGM